MKAAKPGSIALVLVVLLSLAGTAVAGPLFLDEFDSFSLGTRWEDPSTYLQAADPYGLTAVGVPQHLEAAGGELRMVSGLSNNQRRGIGTQNVFLMTEGGVAVDFTVGPNNGAAALVGATIDVNTESMMGLFLIDEATSDMMWLAIGLTGGAPAGWAGYNIAGVGLHNDNLPWPIWNYGGSYRFVIELTESSTVMSLRNPDDTDILTRSYALGLSSLGPFHVALVQTITVWGGAYGDASVDRVYVQDGLPLDETEVIPLPGALSLGLIGLGILAATRTLRRRRD